MSDLRKIARYWNKEVRPQLDRAADSVSNYVNRRNLDGAEDDQLPSENGSNTTESPSPHVEMAHGNSSAAVFDNKIPNEPSLPLSFYELLERGGLTEYKRFQLSEFDDKVVEPLGIGGQADVYLQKHPIFGDVAVKMFSTRENAKNREREMKNIMKLQGHPGVIRLFGFVYNREETEIIGYVMERIDLSMADVIFEESDSGEWKYEYSVAQAVKWIIETAACMSYFHEMEIIHRDLKPHNILVAWNLPGKPIRICDLGLSKNVFLSNGRTTKNVGSPIYMPPEMLRSRQTREELEQKKAGDVYSLAITFWELLHRQKEPPLGRNQIEVFANISMGMRPAIDSSCPPELSEVIRRCWATDATNRPRMRVLMETLEVLLSENEKWKQLTVKGTAEEKDVEQSEF